MSKIIELKDVCAFHSFYGENIQSLPVFTVSDMKHVNANVWVEKPHVKYYSKTRQIDLPESFERVSLEEADLIILSSECIEYVWKKDRTTGVLYPHDGWFNLSYVREEELKDEMKSAAGKKYVWLSEISYLKSKRQVLTEEEFETTLDLLRTNYNIASGIFNEMNPVPLGEDNILALKARLKYYESNYKNITGPFRKYLKEII